MKLTKLSFLFAFVFAFIEVCIHKICAERRNVEKQKEISSISNFILFDFDSENLHTQAHFTSEFA